MSALSPAKIQTVELDESKKLAIVTVDESQAPLAIGRNGVNVNLASKLTGYEIDIEQIGSSAEEPEAPKTEAPESSEKPETEAEPSSAEQSEESQPEPETEKTETEK